MTSRSFFPRTSAEVLRHLTRSSIYWESYILLSHRIETLHIWGLRMTAHNGTLDDLFGPNPIAKSVFFAGLHRILGDGMPRYFLPEANSSKEDLQSIVSDFILAGFEFVNDPFTNKGHNK